ncbi:hypothetical protein OH76DRAFT_290997 [Lentinus brumalis]|uniref:Arylsulfotransferase n=1 Tax=Lentinus brumalis TaxID=2498619 RepID=A0A371DG11_9APHY|nr:hypothetical protein OH76DRAFT_290997 [Polyporus brumalis]
MLARLAAAFLSVGLATAVHPYEFSFLTTNSTPVALNISICSSSFTSSNPLILATPYGKGVSSPGPTIYDASGAVVWHAPEWGVAHDMNVQTLRGQPVLAFWIGVEIKTGWVNGTVVLLDKSYSVVGMVAARAPYRADFHEFEILRSDDDTAVLTSYNRISANLSAIGGPAEGYVLDSLVQIVTLDGSDSLRFNWSAWEHLPLNETYALPGTRGDGTLDSPLDIAHINAVDVSADGRSILMSSRHYQQLMKVDCATGEVEWRMGGMKSDFTFGPRAEFHFQHHGRWHENGKAVSVFDNGASDWEVIEPTARGIYLSVNEKTRHVELVREWLPLYQNITKMMGDVQVLLPGGDVWIDFGTNPWMMEQTWDGEMLFWATLGPNEPSEANGPIGSDRVFRTTEWVGEPAEPPAMAVVQRLNGAGTEVYVSWNGATTVTEYELHAGAGAQSMTVVARTAKAGFENAFLLSQPEPQFVLAVALGQKGKELGRTGVYDVADGLRVSDGRVARI